jgi:hypothetical protein
MVDFTILIIVTCMVIVNMVRINRRKIEKGIDLGEFLERERDERKCRMLD